MKIFTSITELIGKTPLLELSNIEKELGLKARILAKIERNNPSGSVKDRASLAMIEDAEKKGLIKEGATLIEPTSGNTGIGIAAVAAAKGYKAIMVMPESMSLERRKLIRAYGAEIVLTPAKEGMAGSVAKAKALQQEIPNSFIPSQFDNPANVEAHYQTTGPEIYEDTDGNVDLFVAGFGTGGTVSGIGTCLKEKNPNIKIIGVEPASSPLVSLGQAGPHKIQGIGANFVPGNLNRAILDEVMAINDEEAFEFARLVARKEGLLVGISSGAALAAAIALAKREENEGKTIVTLFPDGGDRYLSTTLFEE